MGQYLVLKKKKSKEWGKCIFFAVTYLWLGNFLTIEVLVFL